MDARVWILFCSSDHGLLDDLCVLVALDRVAVVVDEWRIATDNLAPIAGVVDNLV